MVTLCKVYHTYPSMYFSSIRDRPVGISLCRSRDNEMAAQEGALEAISVQAELRIGGCVSSLFWS